MSKYRRAPPLSLYRFSRTSLSFPKVLSPGALLCARQQPHCANQSSSDDEDSTFFTRARLRGSCDTGRERFFCLSKLSR